MMRNMLRTGIASITGRQREILLLWSDGLNQTTIAGRLGVDKSAVCRTLKRAQYNVKQLTEARMTVERLRVDNKLDVSDPEVGKLIISALTPHQAVCFYLYYSERMSIREVGQLLQIDHSTIFRTIQRALARISDVLGDSINILENVEDLDDLVFLIYCNLRDRYEDLPPVVQERVKRTPSTEYIAHDRTPHSDEHGSIRKPRLQIRTNRKQPRGTLQYEQHGRLYQMLQEHYRGVQLVSRIKRNRWKHPIARWLVAIFQVISKPKNHCREGCRCGTECCISSKASDLARETAPGKRTLAELCGLSKNMISLYERGEKAPSVDALINLADFFGVSTDYLLGRKNF